MRSLVGTAAFLAVFCLASGLMSPAVSVAAEPIFTLSDPRGDDHGGGSLRYPRSYHFSTGDLDLISFSARPEKGGTLFEAVFARSIRKPGREAIDAGGATIDRVARFGFYTLNVDVYIDMDRTPGSGRTEMLPGRRAEIDSSTAWERIVAVTPRPYEAREELGHMRRRASRDSLHRSTPREEDEARESLASGIEAAIDSTVFFATRIRVTGPKLQFFVPESFLGGRARDSWAYVVAVSAADLVQRFGVNASFMGSSDFVEGLFILPAAPGLPEDRLGGGRENDDLQPPLMDVLSGPERTQEDALGDYDPRARRRARLHGVVPAERSR